MDQIGVETTKHVRLSYEPATLMHRISAWFIDGLLYIAYIFTFFWLLGTFELQNALENFGWIIYMALMVPSMLYFPVVETIWNGRTVGKKVLGIRVVKIDGTRAGPGAYVIRWLFRYIEIMLTGGVVAILAILINGKGQRLGDMVAKTCVVLERMPAADHRSLYSRGSSNHKVVFEAAGMLSDDEVNVLRNLLNSGSNYSPGARKKLMTKTRKLIEKKTGAVDENLSSEEYLKTVVRDYDKIYSGGDEEGL
jgi:uncharacterized RDD family membrane protein YckC